MATRRRGTFRVNPSRDVRRTPVTTLSTSELYTRPLDLDWTFPDMWDDQHGWTTYTVVRCHYTQHRRVPVVSTTGPDLHGELDFAYQGQATCNYPLQPLTLPFEPTGPFWPISERVIQANGGPYVSTYRLHYLVGAGEAVCLVLTTFGYGLAQRSTATAPPPWLIPMAYLQLSALPPVCSIPPVLDLAGLANYRKVRLYAVIRYGLMLAEEELHIRRRALNSPYDPEFLEKQMTRVRASRAAARAATAGPGRPPKAAPG